MVHGPPTPSPLQISFSRSTNAGGATTCRRPPKTSSSPSRCTRSSFTPGWRSLTSKATTTSGYAMVAFFVFFCVHIQLLAAAACGLVTWPGDVGLFAILPFPCLTLHSIENSLHIPPPIPIPSFRHVRCLSTTSLLWTLVASTAPSRSS